MKKLIAIALAVLMLAGLATVAFAADSPGGSTYHKITITLNIAGKTQSLAPQQCEDGNSVTIEAPAQEGYTYDYMTISGDFEEATRMTKTYTQSSVTITPKSDIDVVIYYKGAGNNGNNDSGNESPNTGVNYAPAILLAVMGLFGMAIATKKILVK